MQSLWPTTRTTMIARKVPESPGDCEVCRGTLPHLITADLFAVLNLRLERSFSLKRIRTIEVGSHTGERVRVAGWLHSLRQLGGVSFLVIRDGWGTIQAVAETGAELAPLQQQEADVESVVSVEGLV